MKHQHDATSALRSGEPEDVNPNGADLQRVVDFFESLTLASTERIEHIYAPNAWFKDPFNEVRGSAAITRIFRHMYAQVDEPRFIITSRYWQGLEQAQGNPNQQSRSAFLTWNFLFRMKRFSRDEQCIRGATHLHFDEQGRIISHRDYWDAAEELYEKLPLLGSMMRLLKRLARN